MNRRKSGKNITKTPDKDGRCKISDSKFFYDSFGKCAIYSITNLVNNKVYIGRDISFPNRLYEHKSDLKNNKHYNQHLQNAWNKYGEENFEFDILEVYEEEFLPSMENWWCNMLNTHNREYGYNIKSTSPNDNVRLSKEHIINATIAREKVFKDRGFRIPQESIKRGAEKRSLIFKGVKWSEERKANYKIQLSTKERPGSKKVINIETKEVFGSARKLSEYLGIKSQKLRNMLNGTSKNNTKFMYLKDYENNNK